MEGDKPLVLKLSVNITQYSTTISVPRYWSFDPRRERQRSDFGVLAQWSLVAAVSEHLQKDIEPSLIESGMDDVRAAVKTND